MILVSDSTNRYLIRSMSSMLSNAEKEDQFRTWVRDYSDMLFSHAVIRGFDRSSARDLVQDTFFSAWKNMDGFEGKASAKNWLFVILKNKITDSYRRAAAHVNTFISEYDTHFDDADHWAKGAYPKELTIDPADSSDAVELNKVLEGCSAKLNRVQKAVFFMKYMDDLESDDICMQLSITSNNYWTILHRAKVQLRACLEKHWYILKGV
ncbi:sigma-70 family RNA polymerase sigma factor [Chryseolinea sp. T2]|uniref:sigma-70 family RNA polymerase sigma factor n=1 Tax=Chryseolinea sp. T2 TaxID=3129255 RepID=UPI0030770766